MTSDPYKAGDKAHSINMDDFKKFSAARSHRGP